MYEENTKNNIEVNDYNWLDKVFEFDNLDQILLNIKLISKENLPFLLKDG